MKTPIPVLSCTVLLRNVIDEAHNPSAFPRTSIAFATIVNPVQSATAAWVLPREVDAGQVEAILFCCPSTTPYVLSVMSTLLIVTVSLPTAFGRNTAVSRRR